MRVGLRPADTFYRALPELEPDGKLRKEGKTWHPAAQPEGAPSGGPPALNRTPAAHSLRSARQAEPSRQTATRPRLGGGNS
jgi:hypothetical protein